MVMMMDAGNDNDVHADGDDVDDDGCFSFVFLPMTFPFIARSRKTLQLPLNA